jgi:ribose/xylose/arabinose/galactoside ABC-type transport system permease subunit
MRILGVLLILVGLTLFASPRITYTKMEEIPHTRFAVKRQKTIVIPRPVAVLIICAGVTALLLSKRKRGA